MCPFEHYRVVRPIAMSVTAAAVVVVGLCGLVSVSFGQQSPPKPMAKTTEVLTDVLLKVRVQKCARFITITSRRITFDQTLFSLILGSIRNRNTTDRQPTIG